MNLKKVTQKNADGSSISYEFDVPKMQGIPDHPGDPKGTDTVPAWLTPGEFVVNAEATRMFEPQIEAMNEAGRAVQKAQGGSIPEYHEDGGVAGSYLGGQGFVDDEREDELRANIYRHALQGDITVDILDNLGNLRPEHKAMAMKGINDRYAANNPDVMVPAVDEVPSPIMPEEPQVPVYPEGLEEVMTGQVPAGNVVPNTQNVGDVPMELSGQDPRDMLSQQEAEREIPIITDEFGAGVLPGEGSRAETINKDRNIAEITGGVIGMDEDVKKVRAQQQADKAQQQRAKEVGADTTSIDAEINKTEEELKDLGSPSGNKAQAVSNALAATEGERTPGDDNKTSEEVEGAGDDQKNEDPTMWEKAKGFIYDAFDEVLDTKGLTQAALLYLGSRALGYSHGGSLNYVGKAYAQQIGNKLKAADKASLSNKFTKESVEKYRKTGNVSDLKATSSWSDDKTNIYVNNAGKTFNVVSQKSADGKIRHIDVDTGKPIDIRKLELNEDRTARVANNSKRSAGIADAEYRARIPKDDQDSIRARLPTPEAIGNATSTKFIEMGLNPAQANKIIADITREMIKDVSVNDKLELTEASLIPYVNKRILTMSLEQQGLAKEFDGVTPEAVATTLGLNINQEDPVAVQKEIKDLATLWKSLNAKGKEYYNNRRTEGMPPILVLLDEVNKGKANKDLFKVK